MNKKKLICGLGLLAIFQIGKAQTTQFYPNDVSDLLNLYGDQSSSSGTARSIGMGGSMGALGGDISAVETNPAGLGIFRNSEASLTMSVSSHKNKASMGSASNSTTNTNFNIPGVGFVLALGQESQPLRVNLGVNYSYQRLDNDIYFGKNKNLSYLYPGANGEMQTYSMENYDLYTNGYKSKMKFSLGTNYMDRFYFGVGLDWQYLNVDRNSTYAQRSSVDGEYMPFNEQLTPYNQEANGFGLSVGVIGKVTPEIRLGIAYHSPVWWSNINDYRWIYNFDESNNVIGNYVYYDRNKNTTAGKLVLSGAYASNIINDDNSLAFNVDFLNYFNNNMNFGGGDIDYRLNNNFINLYTKNSQEYRAGLEYRYKELKLRAGYSYMTSPVKDKTIAGSFDLNSDPVYVKNYLAGAKNKFSLGVGYDMGPFFADFAYQYIKSDYYTSLSGDFFNPSQNTNVNFSLENPILGKVQNTQNNFVLTLGMRF